MTDAKVKGRIIKISKKGWGFISSKDIAFTRIFFHWTSLQQDTPKFPDLKVGMMVEFTPLEVAGKGHRAIHVKVIPKNDVTPVQETNENSQDITDVLSPTGTDTGN